ncbi:hypothetical protein M9H77_14245 [Catharanthus roseus]|uniref:Uncharacterized protein n=1 Tax=Catharanthus roseus TaxID=4058 RepID=A0ACC0BML5_CATRO|nr:hypothetical protein M9H77_14245 [Catharanthus roseus]
MKSWLQAQQNHKLSSFNIFLNSISIDFLTTTCGTKPNHGMKTKEEGMGKKLSIGYEDTSKFMWLPICRKKMDSSFNVLKVHLCDFVKTTFKNRAFGRTWKDDERSKKGKKTKLIGDGSLHLTVPGSSLVERRILKTTCHPRWHSLSPQAMEDVTQNHFP